MKFAIALILASLAATAVQAEVFNYACKVDGKTYPLRVDDKANVLDWRGKTYSIVVASADEPDGCAKYGWRATGHGTSFTFCAATKGVAAIEKDGKELADCDLKRR